MKKIVAINAGQEKDGKITNINDRLKEYRRMIAKFVVAFLTFLMLIITPVMADNNIKVIKENTYTVKAKCEAPEFEDFFMVTSSYNGADSYSNKQAMSEVHLDSISWYSKNKIKGFKITRRYYKGFSYSWKLLDQKNLKYKIVVYANREDTSPILVSHDIVKKSQITISHENELEYWEKYFFRIFAFDEDDNCVAMSVMISGIVPDNPDVFISMHEVQWVRKHNDVIIKKWNELEVSITNNAMKKIRCDKQIKFFKTADSRTPYSALKFGKTVPNNSVKTYKYKYKSAKVSGDEMIASLHFNYEGGEYFFTNLSWENGPVFE